MRSNCFLLAALLLTGPLSASLSTGAAAQTIDGASKADAERAVQGYLAVWSSQGRFDAGAVARFYAPRVVYYGKTFTRAQVLADKEIYARNWPVRVYREVPGTFAARCNADRSRCTVNADMTWRRVSRAKAVSTGRARLTFEFVAVDGGRKIAHEAARIL